jgi:hypothetical protein
MKKTLLIISFMSLFSNFSLAQWLYSPTTIAICDYVDTKNINPDQMLLFYSKPEAAEEAASHRSRRALRQVHRRGKPHRLR